MFSKILNFLYQFGVKLKHADNDETLHTSNTEEPQLVPGGEELDATPRQTTNDETADKLTELMPSREGGARRNRALTKQVSFSETTATTSFEKPKKPLQ